MVLDVCVPSTYRRSCISRTGWRQRIRAQWYRRAAEAEAAKLAFTRVRRKGQLFAAQGRLQDLQGQTGRQRHRSRGGRQTTQQN
jgi:hypothetical protein